MRWDARLFHFMPRMRFKNESSCIYFNFNCQAEIVTQNRRIITGVKSVKYAVFLFKKM